jgi:hypothetical protein
MTAVEKNTVMEIATVADLTLETVAGRMKSVVPETGEASSWFVPPLVVPAFLVALIVARVAYQALI